MVVLNEKESEAAIAANTGINSRSLARNEVNIVGHKQKSLYGI
jgi:hypothetical protein